MCEKCNKGKYYITTAIAYASGKPHIGNTYEIVLADAIARYKRSQGYDVFFQTGTDEHGQKIELKADEAGVTPKEFVDNASCEIKKIWDLMNTSYDKFIRTTDEDHEAQVKKIFKKLYDQGDIYKGAYEGMYCTPCESFWTESQLVDGKCPDCGRECKPAKEEAYFFKMSKYADRLINYINEHPEFIQPVSRKNEMMNNFLLPGLQDLCVSRTSFKWGIPVDFDLKHIVYVWLDALTNYITGIGYDCDGNSTELFNKNWPADLHLIGKDIIRFHTIYWPIFLMALDLPLPKQVFGHPWLLQGGEKMSKSKGNVIYADDMADLFGVDATRYFVLHEMPFENDGIITWDLVIERYNSDLANILGNLVNRTISMSNKYFDGVVKSTGVTEEVDADLKAVVTSARDKVAEKMKNLRVADAITEVFNLFRRCNKYIDETAPWVLAKDEAAKDRLAEVLYNLVESITIGACLFLFGLFYSVLMNFQNIVKTAQEGVCVTVLFDEGISQERIEEIGALIDKRPEVSKKEFISADDAWNSFKEEYLQGYEDGFTENPLADSASYEIYMNDISMQPTLVSYLEGLEGVREVNRSEVTASALTGVNALIAYVSIGIIAILLAVSVFLISNTVTIGISVRKEEITIMKYIGATDYFVRAPFVIEGMLIGAIGALIPLGIIYLLYNNVIEYIEQRFSILTTILAFLPVDAIFKTLLPLSLLIGIGIGFLGSITTVRKHLRV